MADREKIIRYYKGTEGAETAVKLVDLAEAVAKNRKFRLAGFLDPYGCEIAETVAANYPLVKVDFNGGYQGAERQRVAFVHEDFLGTVSFDIAVLQVAWNGQFCRISHRDVLGAVLATGIDRNIVGDILLKSDNAKIIIDQKMLDYLQQNLTQIGTVSVSRDVAELVDIEPKEERCKEIRATVASLRIDSIAAAGFGSSRSKMADDIAADKIKVNWQSIRSASQIVKAGDIISMRGRGRLEVAEVLGQTKKGRTSVFLKRYI